MQFRENADVYTLDNKKVGEVERVVLDPQTKEITHLVVRKGFLLTEDKVVPIELVESATEDQVTLRKMGDLESLPNFEETQYVRVDRVDPKYPYEKGYAWPFFWYPTVGMTWWSRRAYPLYPRPRYVVETWRNIPADTVPLKEGADVISVDGEDVGSVERIFADPERERATHLLISEGLILKEKKLVPTTWIMSVEEDEVRLAVSADFVDNLPETETFYRKGAKA